MNKLLLLSVLFFGMLNSNAQQACKKWNPGHYLQGFKTTTINGGEIKKVWTDPDYRNNLKGIALVYTWEELETSFGNYNFTRIQGDIDSIIARNLRYNVNKKLVIMFASRQFNRHITIPGNADDGIIPGPAYLSSDPAYNGGWFHAKKGLWVPKMWESSISARISALHTAMGNAFNATPEVELVIEYSETAIANGLTSCTGIGPGNNPPYCMQTLIQAGFNRINYINQIININNSMINAWPETNVAQYANYLPGDGMNGGNSLNYLDDILFNMRDNGGGFGNTDVKPFGGSSPTTYPLFETYKGQLPLVGGVETQTYTGVPDNGPFASYNWTPEHIFKFGVDTLNLNYMLWLNIQNSGAQAPGDTIPNLNFPDDILPEIIAQNARINSIRPTNINCANEVCIASAGPDKFITCFSPTTVLEGSSFSSNMQYSWSGPGILNGGNTLNPTVNAGGSYTLTAFDTIVFCTIIDTVNVEAQNSLPNANAGFDVSFGCMADDTLVILSGSSSGNEAKTYSWSGPNSTSIVDGANTLTATVIDSGMYTLIVTDTLTGCSASDQVSVTQSPILTVMATASEFVNCFRDSISLSATVNESPVNFNWTGPNGFTSMQQNPMVLSEGIYTLIVTNSQNCSASDTATVWLAPYAMSPTFDLNPSSFCSTDSVVVFSGGMPSGGTYSIDGFVVSSFDPGSVTPPNFNTVEYTIIDSNGCEGIRNVSFSVENGANCSITSVSNTQFSNAVVLFPNPANQSVTLFFDNPVSNASVLVINSCGKEILFQSVSNVSYTTLDLHSMSSGIYFLEITDNHEKIILRLIKD